MRLRYPNDPYVWYGLVNEPHDMPTQQWFDAANAAVAAIRSAGADQLILVPGNSWSGAHCWTDEDYGGSNARHILRVKDPLDYFFWVDSRTGDFSAGAWSGLFLLGGFL